MTPDIAQPDHAEYSDWDAAYVLGALSPAERKDFETHLETCERCRAGVAELTGLPGLLGRLDPPRAFALLEPSRADDGVIPPLPANLVARIEQRESARRRRRARWVIGIAVAAVVAGAIIVPLSIASTTHPTVSTTLAQVVASPLSANVKLTSVGWGTRVDMSCRYGGSAGAPDDARWDYSLWVVDDSGTSSELSSWSAKSDSTVDLMAGTAVPVGRIAQVQVRSVDDGSVLLSSDLSTSAR